MQARHKCKELSNEEKENKYKSMSEENKQRLKNTKKITKRKKTIIIDKIALLWTTFFMDSKMA